MDAKITFGQSKSIEEMKKTNHDFEEIVLFHQNVFEWVSIIFFLILMIRL